MQLTPFSHPHSRPELSATLLRLVGALVQDGADTSGCLGTSSSSQADTSSHSKQHAVRALRAWDSLPACLSPCVQKQVHLPHHVQSEPLSCQQQQQTKNSAPIRRLTRVCGGSAGTGVVRVASGRGGCTTRGEGDGSARAPSGEGNTAPPGWFAISSGF